MHRCLLFLSLFLSAKPPFNFPAESKLVGPELGGADGRLVGPELGGADGRLVKPELGGADGRLVGSELVALMVG